MDQTSNDFHSLMSRVRDGDPDAATELFSNYADAVRKVVRRHLRQQMRRQYDSVDFEQSVWASFFLTSAENYAFLTPEDLVAFLSRLAFNKVVDATRKRLGVTRDSRRERSLD